MNIDELFAAVGEIEIEDEDEVEEDLYDALHHLHQCILMMEAIIIQDKKIKRLPDGLLDVMEEASDFLDQWNYDEDNNKG